MLLHTSCHNCKKEIPIQSNAVARTELEDERGEEFVVECKKCGTKDVKHVNRINASPNLVPVAIAAVISVIVTLVLWYILGAIGTITILIPLIIWYQQSNAAHKFNVVRIPRNI